MASKDGKGRRVYAVAEGLGVARFEDDYYQEFYAACSAFGYKDIMAVSRSLDVTPRTVRNWKYRKTLPQDGIVFGVVSWVREGKPILMIPADQVNDWRAHGRVDGK